MNPKQKLAFLLFFLIAAAIAWTLYSRPDYIEPVVIPNLLSGKEIEMIRTKAEPLLKTSTIVGNNKIDPNIRKSDTAWLPKTDPDIAPLIARCAALVGKKAIHCESLQVLRYQEGGKYNPHQDAQCVAGNAALDKEMNVDRNGQRIATVILALTDDFEGGETNFPNLGKQYKLRRGDGLLFRTLDRHGRCTDKALHGGQPVTKGTKWICNLWIHEKETNY